MAQEAILDRRIRPLLAMFILGLVLGGLTAVPLDVKRLEVVKAVGQAEKGRHFRTSIHSAPSQAS